MHHHKESRLKWSGIWASKIYRILIKAWMGEYASKCGMESNVSEKQSSVRCRYDGVGRGSKWYHVVKVKELPEFRREADWRYTTKNRAKEFKSFRIYQKHYELRENRFQWYVRKQASHKWKIEKCSHENRQSILKADVAGSRSSAMDTHSADIRRSWQKEKNEKRQSNQCSSNWNRSA